LILEGIFSGVASIVQEAIKVRPKPRDVVAGKGPAQAIGITDAPRAGRPARSVDFSQHPTRSMKEMREAPSPSASTPEPWSNWPAVATLAHFFGDARHRLFGSANAVSSMPEPWVLHDENPHATPHPATDRNACGLCISYVAQGRGAVSAVMVEVCPGCGGGGGRHQRDCERVLADHGVYESDWTDLPGQARWDEWARDNERRGHLL